jgi:membrane-anchored protein YejM (alkaline phosphatase superfamily)
VVVAVDLIFGAEVVLVLLVLIGSKVYACLNMTDKDWFSNLDDLSLHLKSVVWIDMVEYPNTIIIRSGGGHAG